MSDFGDPTEYRRNGDGLLRKSELPKENMLPRAKGCKEAIIKCSRRRTRKYRCRRSKELAESFKMNPKSMYKLIVYQKL